MEAAKARAELFTEPPLKVQNAVAPDLAYNGGGKVDPPVSPEPVRVAADKYHYSY